MTRCPSEGRLEALLEEEDGLPPLERLERLGGLELLEGPEFLKLTGDLALAPEAAGKSEDSIVASSGLEDAGAPLVRPRAAAGAAATWAPKPLAESNLGVLEQLEEDEPDGWCIDLNLMTPPPTNSSAKVAGLRRLSLDSMHSAFSRASSGSGEGMESAWSSPVEDAIPGDAAQ